MGRHRLTKAAVIVLTVAITVRLAPVLWTPYPFNPDGFVFAAQARETVAAGTLARELIEPHGYVFPTLLSLLAAVTAVAPLRLAQPTIAIVEALPSVIAMGLVWRLAAPTERHRAVIVAAALAAGLTLALEGLYLRRTVTVSYEVLGLLFVALVAIGAQRVCQTRQVRWALTTVTLLFVLPITHHLSTFMAALTLTVVIALAVGRDRHRALRPGLLLLAPFWLYIGLY